jgi:hypothetical protein
MKWAKADVFPPAPLEGRVLRGDIDDIRGLPKLVDDLHQAFIRGD